MNSFGLFKRSLILFQVANWLELYVEALGLNVWTSSEAVSATRNESSNKWDVVIRRAGGKEHVLHVDHVVVAPGFSFKKTVLPGQVSCVHIALHSVSAELFVGGLRGYGYALYSVPLCQRPLSLG